MNEIKRPISTQQTNKNTLLERGQAMVETAFVMIILLVLLSLIIDLGRAFFTYLALQNAAAEGAYYAAKEPAFEDNDDNPDPNNIKFRVKHESPDSPLLDWNTTDVEVDVTYWCSPAPVDIENPTDEELERERSNTSAPSGSIVVVRVEYKYEPIGPVAGMLALLLPDAFSNWDGEFSLIADARQLVLQQTSDEAYGCTN
jgi:hypothetical protein